MQFNSIQQNNSISLNPLEILAKKLVVSKNENLSQLILAQKKENFSVVDIENVMSKIFSIIDSTGGEDSPSAQQGVKAAKVFFKAFPQYFDLDASTYRFPQDSRERKAVIHLLMMVDPRSLRSLRLDQLSLEEVLELLPQEKLSSLENKEFSDHFDDLPLIKHLNQQKTAEEFLNLLDTILGYGAWASQGLAQNLSSLNVSKLSTEQKITLYNKIEDANGNVNLDKEINVEIADELREIEDPQALMQKVRELLPLCGSWAGYFLIGEIGGDSHFENLFKQLDFDDKFLLAETLSASKTLKNKSGVLERMMNALNFHENLKKATHPQEYLEICEKIISLGQTAGEWVIPPQFIDEICHEDRQEVHLNFEQKVDLIGKMGDLGKNIFKYIAEEEEIWQWIEGDEIKNINRLSEENPEQARISLLKMHEALAQQKNYRWTIFSKSPFDDLLSIEDILKIVQLWSRHGPEPILMLNEQMDDAFLTRLEGVKPASLRFDICKKLILLLGEPFATKLVENFDAINPKEMKEEECQSLFYLLISQGPAVATSLFSHLQTYIKNPEEKLLMYKQIALYGGEVFKEFIDYQEEFSKDSQASLLEYVNFLARRGLAFEHVEKICSLCTDLEGELFLEMLTWDPSIKEKWFIKYVDTSTLPFLIKEAKEINEEEMKNLSLSCNQMRKSDLHKPFVDVFDDIQKNKSLFNKHQLLKWYGYCLSQKAQSSDFKMIGSMISLIYQYQNPALRFLLTRHLFDIKQLYLKVSEKQGLKPKCIEEFSRILFSKCIEFGMPKNLAEECYGKITNKTSDVFKDIKNSNILLDFLLNVIANSPFSHEEFVHISQMFVKILDKKETLFSELQTATSILNVFGRQDFLFCIENYASQSAVQFFIEQFQKVFPVKVEGDFMQAFQNSFGKFRQFNALFSYLGSVNQLSQSDKKEVLKALLKYVEAVLSGKDKFIELRYNTDDKRYPHLEKIFSHQKNLKEMWLDKGKTIALEEDYTIEESEDAEDLLLIGTEVSSCMRVNGSPENNKCLVGYLLQGDVHPIVIKKDGKIVARCMLRLLWDETNKTPVLLQEKNYSNFRNPMFEEAINQFAIERAKRMGIPLVSKEVRKSSSSYQGSVMFLGGPAPYLYSDAGDGVMNGHQPFEFVGCCVLYHPK